VALARAIAVLSVGLQAVGCTAVVGGKARPAPDIRARPLAGQTVRQVLLDDTALSKLLQQPFRADPHFRPRFGGPDQLQDEGPASSADCLGVAVMLQQSSLPIRQGEGRRGGELVARGQVREGDQR